jgi:hypothetical protein
MPNISRSENQDSKGGLDALDLFQIGTSTSHDDSVGVFPDIGRTGAVWFISTIVGIALAPI